MYTVYFLYVHVCVCVYVYVCAYVYVLYTDMSLMFEMLNDTWQRLDLGH